MSEYFSVISHMFTYTKRKLSVYLTLSAITLYIIYTLSGVRKLCAATGENAYPYFFPLLISSIPHLFSFLLGGIVLLCDAPFPSIKAESLFEKRGSNPRLMHVIGFIAAFSFLYTFWIHLISVIIVLPYVDIGATWGRIINTLVRTDAQYMFLSTIRLSSRVIAVFSPLEAMLYSTFFFWASLFILGMLMCLCNILGSRIGVYLATAIALLDVACYNQLPASVQFWSPATMTRLETLQKVPGNRVPTVHYAVCFFWGISIMICIVLFVVNHVKEKRYFTCAKLQNVRSEMP